MGCFRILDTVLQDCPIVKSCEISTGGYMRFRVSRIMFLHVALRFWPPLCCSTWKQNCRFNLEKEIRHGKRLSTNKQWAGLRKKAGRKPEKNKGLERHISTMGMRRRRLKNH
ncbi:hypothetical protein PoB_004971100 [Plakobranchus ocellatus]|uniref:Uncharacterized protein n=1 Tax=Plakobranchus ocellatus TaxID=259542 RepID=A0AAV4BVS6_9GAST|nr:hypothetical protein PoB_004971100 [Plakobranchus ocellatus]